VPLASQPRASLDQTRSLQLIARAGSIPRAERELPPRTYLMLAAWTWLPLALPATAGERLAGRAHVLDGDTIAVSAIHVRLKGVAAPEVAHFGEPGEAGVEEAKRFMVELVEGETVVCDLTQEITHGRRVGWLPRRSEHRGRAGQRRIGTGLPAVLAGPVC
jgi:endonuclease YncB( thermonuclease family)